MAFRYTVVPTPTCGPKWFSLDTFAVILQMGSHRPGSLLRALVARMSEIAKRLEKAEKFLHKGRPESALDEYLAILDDDPRNDSVRQSAADLCLTLGRNDEAARLVSEMFNHYVAVGESGKIVVTYKRLSRL